MQIKRHDIYIYQVPVYIRGFPGGSDGKESACNTGGLGSIPGLGSMEPGFDPFWRREGLPMQYSGPENPHGQRSLTGHSSQSLRESDMTE